MEESTLSLTAAALVLLMYIVKKTVMPFDNSTTILVISAIQCFLLRGGMGRRGMKPVLEFHFLVNFLVKKSYFQNGNLKVKKEIYQFVEMPKKWECGVDKYSTTEIDRIILSSS